MENSSILSWITFAPLFGILAILVMPKERARDVKWIALIPSIPQLILAGYIAYYFKNDASVQFAQNLPWIDSFNIRYYLGVDSLSVSMVILTALIGFIAVIASWGIEKNVKAYFSLLLFLNMGMMGTFVALDFFLFYLFWEIMLLPMYFLIGIWGGPRKEYAAIKFFLYTLAGSVFMLLVMVALYLNSQGNIFDITKLAELSNQTGSLKFDGAFSWFRFFCWLGLFVGFAIKVPMFPFHTWLPDAHVEAPTAISVILAGVLLKMGTYGMLRFNFMIFPDITYQMSKCIAIFGVINIVYGAFCAMAQTDIKKIIAYSSVSHMGFVLLGISAFNEPGINGGVLQMFNHGTITAMMFIIVGIIYDRAHHRDVNKFGGLYAIMPRYAVWTAFAFFAGLGLPGLSGFIGEALVFMGSYERYPGWTIVALSGVVLGAAYLLWTIQRAFLGKPNEKYKDFPDIDRREVISLLPLGLIVLFLGIYPKPLLNLIQPKLKEINEHVLENRITVQKAAVLSRELNSQIAQDENVER